MSGDGGPYHFGLAGGYTLAMCGCIITELVCCPKILRVVCNSNSGPAIDRVPPSYIQLHSVSDLST